MSRNPYIFHILLLLLFIPVLLSRAIGSDNCDDFILKGDIYLEMNDSVQAMDNFKKALKCNNRSAIVYNRIGFTYFKTKQYDSAITNYEKSIKFDASMPHVYNNLGVANFCKKKFSVSKDLYLKAVFLKPDYAKVMVNLAVVNFYLRNYRDAYEWYIKALKINRKYVEKRFDKKKAKNRLITLSKENPDDLELQKIMEWVQKKWK